MRIREICTAVAMVGLLGGVYALGEEGSGGKTASQPMAEAHAKHEGHGEGMKKKDVVDGVASLDVYAEGGRLHLLTAVREGSKGPVLRYSASVDGERWSAPVAVGVGQAAPEPAHRGMDVQVAASGEKVVAVWTAGSESRFGRGPLVSAVSADGGKTWKAGVNPADDGSVDGDHAFIDVVADEDGVFHLVWLDGRDGAKGLRYARSSDGGMTWSKNQTLVKGTCECCWNTIIAGHGGKLRVLFRNKDPRDMAVIGSEDGGRTWGRPVTVGPFGWDINGCPHVGGGLTFDGEALHAVVWTAKSESVHGAFVLSSRDGGATWTRPTQLGDSQSWHADVAALEGGKVVAVWDAFGEEGMGIFTCTSTNGGRSWGTPQRLSEREVSATHPRIVGGAGGAWVFWTEKREGEVTRWVSKKIQ